MFRDFQEKLAQYYYESIAVSVVKVPPQEE